LIVINKYLDLKNYTISKLSLNKHTLI